MKKAKFIAKAVLALIVSIVFLVSFLNFPIIFFGAYIHEAAHVVSAERHGVKFCIKEIIWNIPEDLPTESEECTGNNSLIRFCAKKTEAYSQIGRGETAPVSVEECKKYNDLPLEDRKEINRAGIKAKIFVYLIIIVLLIAFIGLMLRKMQKMGRAPFILLLVLFLIISIVLVFAASIYVTVEKNVTTKDPNSDWNRETIDCAPYSSVATNVSYNSGKTKRILPYFC